MLTIYILLVSVFTVVIIILGLRFATKSVPTKEKCLYEDILDAFEERLLAIKADSDAYRNLVSDIEQTIEEQLAATSLPLNKEKRLQREIICPLLTLRQQTLDSLFILSETDLQRLLTVNHAFTQFERDSHLEKEQSGGYSLSKPVMVCTSLFKLASDPIYGSNFTRVGELLNQVSIPNDDEEPCLELMQRHYEAIPFSETIQSLHGQFYMSMADICRINSGIISKEITVIS